MMKALQNDCRVSNEKSNWMWRYYGGQTNSSLGRVAYQAMLTLLNHISDECKKSFAFLMDRVSFEFCSSS